MVDFFEERAERYDKQMRENVTDFDDFYRTIADPITATQQEIEILDLGAGTGLELAAILKKAPKAHITCIDLSKKMLEELKRKYPNNNIIPIIGSYLSYDFKNNYYDYAVSVMTLHHFLPETKTGIYRKIVGALRNGSVYIEGDYIVPPKEEKNSIKNFYDLKNGSSEISDTSHHIDIPLSKDSQRRLFAEAGLNDFKVYFHRGINAVYSGRK